jgi:hypothetical protein
VTRVTEVKGNERITKTTEDGIEIIETGIEIVETPREDDGILFLD